MCLFCACVYFGRIPLRARQQRPVLVRSIAAFDTLPLIDLASPAASRFVNNPHMWHIRFQDWWYNSIIKHDHSSMEQCQRFCESDIYCGACDFWSVSFPGRISPSVVVSQSVCLSVRVREHLAQFCSANLSYPPRSSSPPSLSLSLSLSGVRAGLCVPRRPNTAKSGPSFCAIYVTR